MIQKHDAGMLYQTFVAANALRERALLAGRPRAEANQIVTDALRQAWPKGREEPWHYLCDACEDTGWERHVCAPQRRCNRRSCQPSDAPAHDYMMPCWCQKGRDRVSRAKGETDELAEIAKTAKRPTRFGR